MKRLALGGLVVAIAAVVLADIGLAAPARKDDPLGPITTEQLTATEKNLKRIALAMHAHNDEDGRLPRNYKGKDGKPLLSWRVAILRWLDEEKLYKEFKLDEAWDSDHNIKLVDRIPKVFAAIRGKSEKGQTFYQMFAGKRTLLEPLGDGISIAALSVADGTSNTFMVAEGANPVVWTKPDDIPFDGKTAPRLGGMFDGDFHVALGDGEVKRIPKGFDPDVLKLAIVWNDGQIIDIDGAITRAKEKE